MKKSTAISLSLLLACTILTSCNTSAVGKSIKAFATNVIEKVTKSGNKTARKIKNNNRYIEPKQQPKNVVEKEFQEEAMETTEELSEKSVNRAIIGRYPKRTDSLYQGKEGFKIMPNYHASLYSRGLAYYDKGDYDRAIADFEALLKIDPNNVKAKEILNLARQKKQ